MATMTDRLLTRSARTPAGSEIKRQRDQQSIMVTIAVRSCFCGLAGHSRHRQQDHDLLPGLVVELSEDLGYQQAAQALPGRSVARSFCHEVHFRPSRRRRPRRLLSVQRDIVLLIPIPGPSH